MKKLVSLASAGVLAFALTAPSAAPALADGPECDLYSHCYGMAHYPDGVGIEGLAVDLWTDCLHLDTPLSDVATHETWMWTNAATWSWVEGGYIRGIVAGGDTETFFRWFWGEYTGTTFYTHFIQWAAVADWKQLWFSRYTHHRWGVYLSGSFKGQTAQTASSGTYVQVGAETTEPQVYSHGKSRNLWWLKHGASSWAAGSNPVPAGTSGVYSVTASGPSMEQTSLQNSCSPAPAAAKPAAKSPTDADLQKLAIKVAGMHGEKSPKGLTVVKSTRGAAQKLVGGGAKVDSDQAVLVLQLAGEFVGRAPSGAKLPRGNTMTVTVDAKTGEVTDMSLGVDRKDLGKLGTAKSL